jgi:hypothetical protein
MKAAVPMSPPSTHKAGRSTASPAIVTATCAPFEHRLNTL